ncbi:ribosome silencing factor [Anaerosinus massiliensis]|uniref:ribosome silencing factor n=1 Tax=Massilibacillus massiliensis TaxID=1806837 RepID=UPI000A62EF52|nr:ribosome silencing factor [Massilibacillus massiliensis]
MFKTTEELSKAIATAASNKKARDILILDMRDLTVTTDYFMICSANSTTQVKAIADNIEDELAEKGVFFTHKEGYREGNWILLDYGDCVAHIFIEEERQFYNLERLWGDAPAVQFED